MTLRVSPVRESAEDDPVAAEKKDAFVFPTRR
jgi:hypothetical protein